MHRIVRFAMWSAAVTAGLAPLPSLSAQPSPVVAVVAFNVHSTARNARGAREFAGVGTAVAELLAAELTSTAGVTVLDRARVQRAVSAQQASRTGMVDRDAAVNAARQLGAAHVIYGGFTADASGNVRLDARGVNVATGAVEFTERLQGDGDGVVALVQRLSSRLVGGMSLPARPGFAAAATSTLPLSALVTYGKALDSADRGDRAQAQTLLRAVLSDNPDFTPAKSALAGLTPE